LVVTKPALFVSGGRDPWLRPLCGSDPRAAILADLRVGFTAVEELRIERAGHMLSEESPLEVSDILLRSLSRLPHLSW
jgi:pimeloyl-ACP methyl ester carboxylesterase